MTVFAKGKGPQAHAPGKYGKIALLFRSGTRLSEGAPMGDGERFMHPHHRPPYERLLRRLRIWSPARHQVASRKRISVGLQGVRSRIHRRPRHVDDTDAHSNHPISRGQQVPGVV